MKEKKKDRRTLMEDWRLIRRALGILNKLMPHFWFYQIACTLTETFFPYFGLYMSAQMVNELAGVCDYRRLALMAGCCRAGGSCVKSILFTAMRLIWLTLRAVSSMSTLKIRM